MGISAELDRPRIQALRAAPPGLASDGPRRRVFGAALEQWDALLAASRTVVPAASPILVFYALSQATRALCASRISGQRWNPSAHGLKISNSGGSLGDTVLTPDGGDATSFALLCRAVGDRPLSTPTTLGALWAANPQLEPVHGLGFAELPVLKLSQRGTGDQYLSAIVSGPTADDLPTDLTAARDVVADRLASHYPGSHEGLEVKSAGTGRDGGAEVELAWRDSEGRPRPIEAVAPGLVAGARSGAYLRPALNEAGDVLGFLSLWWATLLALSSVARYSPDRWTAALARDRSAHAIPIEEALQIAQELLPYMILAALTDE